MSLPKRIDELDTASQASVSLSAGAAVAVVTGGKTIQTSIGALVPAGSNIVSVKDPQFGAKGDGVTDDHDAIMAASLAAVSSGGSVWFPHGTYLVGSTLALTSAHANLKWFGCGYNQSIIKKNFNGDLITVTSCTGFECTAMHLQGQVGTFTGKGVVFSAGNGLTNFPVFLNCMTEGFADTHIEFGIDAGHSAQLIGHRARLGSGQTNPRIIHVNGPDTGATIRRMAACSLEGFIQLNGALDFYVVGSQFTNITTDSATGPWFVSSCRWGNGGVAMTLSGIEGHIVGNSFSGDVTLDTTFSGSFIGNAQTGGVFTNNSVVTTAIVMHHPLSASYQLLYQHTLPVGQAVPHRILHNGSVSAGDADITFSALSSQTIINYATSLTANRTVTLSTTGAVDGDRVTIFRNGGDTGGPWTVAIGGTGTNLSTNSFCVAEYNGSFWVVSHFGWLSTSIKPSSSDGSAGISTTITTASLVGKTVTVKDGLITGFA